MLMAMAQMAMAMARVEYTDGWLNAYHDSIHHVPLGIRTKPHSDMSNRGYTDGWNAAFPMEKSKIYDILMDG